MATLVNGKPPIYLIDDSDSFRGSLESMLRESGYLVHAYTGVEQFLKAGLPQEGVILCDMLMPGASGLDLQDKLNAHQSILPLIFISAESTLRQGIHAMKNGAFDFLIKPTNPQELLAALDRAHQTLLERRLVLAKRALFNKAFAGLSPREKKVHDLLLAGHANAKIAQELGISIPTVKEHKSNVYRKLNIKTLSELIDLAS